VVLSSFAFSFNWCPYTVGHAAWSAARAVGRSVGGALRHLADEETRHAHAAAQIREDEALARRLQLEVRLCENRLPRQPLRFKPSLLEFIGVL